MEPYVGIVVFELSSATSNKSYFREDFYIVYANTDEDARKRVHSMAQEQEIEGGVAAETIRIRHIVDVAPALDGRVDRDCDLYSRHFASLEDYQRFEMMLGGRDPFDAED